MRCKKDAFIEGAIFHIYNKTPKNKLFFYDRSDYQYFLDKFRKNIEKYPCEIYAYCLMPNHFHFLLKQNSADPLYRIFNDSLTSYTLHYNKKHGFKGRLLQDKLQHKQVIEENYLTRLMLYIHNNPFKAGLVQNLEDWEYSNYPEYIGIRDLGLYSKELLKMCPVFFANYKNIIEEYQGNPDDKLINELIFE